MSYHGYLTIKAARRSCSFIGLPAMHWLFHFVHFSVYSSCKGWLIFLKEGLQIRQILINWICHSESSAMVVIGSERFNVQEDKSMTFYSYKTTRLTLKKLACNFHILFMLINDFE